MSGNTQCNQRSFKDPSEVNLTNIRSLWARTSTEAGRDSPDYQDVLHELEMYLFATASSISLRINALVREIHEPTSTQAFTDQQIKRLLDITQQVELCSQIALFSIKRSVR